MNFEELGVLLRQERERRGLSVAEVANRLKLMPRVVRAIEQAELEELPQAAYARGFVKAYGTLLALDPELLYAGMEDAWPDDSHPPPVPYEPAGERKPDGMGRLAVIICLMLVLAVAAWFWLSRDMDEYLPSGLRLQAEPEMSARRALPSPPVRAKGVQPPAGGNLPPPRQTSPPPPASPAPSAAATSSAPAQTAAPSQAAPAVQSPAPGQAAAPATPAESRLTLTENAPSATPQAEAPPAATQAEQRNLVIIALAECWVHSTADGTDTRQFSLRKGDTFALTFSKKLVLKLGNAGGVKIRLDGQELGSPGEAGQVKTLTYPANP